MDKDTRNAIERATLKARKLLEVDFANQLEGDFDVHRHGEVAPTAGKHLSARQVFSRERVVAAIEHKRAGGMGAADAARDYLRDAAFTTLNRFVALKMLEARDLVQECITKGEQSGGYREFCGMAPGLAMLPESAGYRLYLESLFDELSTEVKVLFDRRDPSSVLWPRRATFEQLLEILNAKELAGVWVEDETIGWVYQFFNGEEDRAAARYDENGKPKLPQSSRELAVRNQFFTPRYIVRFLADNTLGRIWYEMRGTKTILVDKCTYLVRKPVEEFTPRLKKDPRDLRVLDPACGSGHFLLYAFDLLLAIYEEAYADPEIPKSESTGTALADDYPSIEELRKAAPGLVIAHNLYGVDIDPRCAQIAQLALWMRAQKAYRDFGLGRADRERIRRSNIVVAEPLVADEQIAEEFVAKLGDAELGRVFKLLTQSLSLAGDLGLLLRVEQLLAWQAKPGQTQDLFAPPQERMRTVVEQFVGQDSSRSTSRRLFALDAAYGLELAELAARRYDVVLMNPPFGETSQQGDKYLDKAYERSKGNLYIAFLYRSVELLTQDGMVGAITDATLIHQTRYEDLRSDLLDQSSLGIQILVANGWGVLDAYVETACLVLSRKPGAELFAFDIRDAGDDRAQLLSALIGKAAIGDGDERVRKTLRTVFQKLPKKVLTFWLPAELLDLYDRQPSLAPCLVDARCGMSSSDNSRFYKLRWEVPISDLGEGKRWRFLANGGAPSPVFRPQAYVVNWGDDGREVKAQVAALYGSASRTIINESYYFRGGLTYGKRTESFSVQFLPPGQVFSNEGQAIFPNTRRNDYGLLAYLNASCVAYLLNAIAGQHKEAGYVGSIPAPPEGFLLSSEVVRRTQRAHEILTQAASGIPESQEFTWPFAVVEEAEKSARAVIEWFRTASDEFARLFLENDVALEASIGFKEDSAKPWTGRHWKLASVAYGCNVDELPTVVSVDVVCYLLGIAFGRWEPSLQRFKKSDPLNALLPTVPGQRASALADVERILVDDEGHVDDIITALEYVQRQLEEFGVCSDELSRACEEIDSRNSDARWVVRTQLFSLHLDRYTRSRRRVPIYWQLATPTASYSVWLYIHAVGKDTLFRVQSDYVAPKVLHEERRLALLTSELRDSATAERRKQLAAQEALVQELRAFLDEIKRVAPLWRPSLDDGVIINFAPLWRLVPQNKVWQKELKSTWDELCEGKYDWARLAMHLWPERVVPKCGKDRSLAIAHGLEDVFWVEGTDGKWTARTTLTKSVDELVKERASPAVKSALKSLLEAPVAGGKSAGRNSGGRRKALAAAEGGNA